MLDHEDFRGDRGLGAREGVEPEPADLACELERALLLFVRREVLSLDRELKGFFYELYRKEVHRARWRMTRGDGGGGGGVRSWVPVRAARPPRHRG